MKTHLSRAALAAAAMALGLSGAQATTAVGTLNVSLSVTASCWVNTSSLSFGTATGVGDTGAKGSISGTCTPGVSASVDLNYGANSNGTTQRKMVGAAGAAHTVSYDLLTGTRNTWTAQPLQLDAAGNFTIGINGVAHLGDTGVPPDNYSDQVTITVSY